MKWITREHVKVDHRINLELLASSASCEVVRVPTSTSATPMTTLGNHLLDHVAR